MATMENHAASGEKNKVEAGDNKYFVAPSVADTPDENEKERPTAPAKQTANYEITDPLTKAGHTGLLHYGYDLIRGKDLRSEGLEQSDKTHDKQPAHTWKAQLSLLCLKLLWFINTPMAMMGNLVEDTVNLFLANGGILKTLFRLFFYRSRLVILERDHEDYVSFGGFLDQRFALYITSKPQKEDGEATATIFPGTEYGSKFTADVLVMASKLAYENAKYVEKVVTKVWKMHFVAFYDCWNEFQKQNNTQVFIFTDRPENARAVVVAFRGTEPFHALDWSTDFDFSWFDIEGLGQVHVGFMEALGLGDRNRMETFKDMYHNAQTQQTNAHEGSHMSGIAHDQENKKLAYDHITATVKEIMKKNPEAKLFVTGHSLGGALANLYTAFLFFNNEDLITNRFGALYTFGQPRVGSEQYSKFLISKIGKSRYWRVVYGNDLVPRIPFDDLHFEFKHCGYCYYFDERFEEQTLKEAPNHNYFSWRISTIIGQRIGALYDLILSCFSGWIYGPEFREDWQSICVRFGGLFMPGMSAHLMNNYVSAIRLGPTLLEARIHDKGANGLINFFLSYLGRRTYPAVTAYHH
ncbi:hypothetical protein R1sor_024715 [Riccia sorocarpa]|uniref:Fungal lipase-type domain-containing protein n=1 Tax=Riccia sorocarpa TaxID=122646 RepID=A0ABD3GVA1_9MARC